ncbi:MAG: DNA polymerase III subunit gamma/tau [Candidatus Pelagibacter sp.]|nr:DNA polymerase III subunit gamma/tau [Candidatus Pelagibacter sp.]OUV86737.1 MAG: DNA polymerase III subunit gamma/tau [Pelagibacteraceae bacterium TMED136]|tara:strand:+ start:35859 stop:37523 length:1665 start_codon:yes stop_codon:yes gene_type:complete
MNNRKPLALKYRPQKFNELIGQNSMVLSIQNAIKSDRIPNAYLLTGIRGTGKTSTARIIAKAINCEFGFAFNNENKNKDFCECDNCKAITNSNHIDILEMDAASKTGIDDIREILEASKYHPSIAKFKVFIIDEVHMLSKQAFNALLKTLEEPPSHLKFILATTEIKKIPVTILSRCQRFDLRRIKVDEMNIFLNQIAQKEKADIDSNSLSLISKSSEGSVRDALSILDQVIITYNLAGEKATEDKVRKILGLADESKIIDLMSHVVEGNCSKAIESSEEIFDIGADPKLVLHSLLEVCYLMTRTKILGKISKDLNVSETESKRLEEIVKNLDLTYLTMLWHFLIKGLEDLNLYPNLSVAFQMLLTRLCHLKNMPDPQEVLNSMKDIKINNSNIENSDNLITKPKTQIKNISQELEKPKSNLNENKITSKINSLNDLINITEKEKEIELKFDLERNVRLVKFSNGKIDIAFNEKLSKDFIKKLTSKLLEWTGQRWIITLSKDIGDQTIYEKKYEVKKKLFEDAKKTEVYQRIKELFPDAEITDVEQINDQERDE